MCSELKSSAHFYFMHLIVIEARTGVMNEIYVNGWMNGWMNEWLKYKSYSRLALRQIIKFKCISKYEWYRQTIQYPNHIVQSTASINTTKIIIIISMPYCTRTYNVYLQNGSIAFFTYFMYRFYMKWLPPIGTITCGIVCRCHQLTTVHSSALPLLCVRVSFPLSHEHKI